jgi:zinc and cadmium transporter
LAKVLSAGTALLLPTTAGGFVYLAAADLIPELQHDRSLRGLAVQSLLIMAGIAVMSALTLVD